LPGGLLSKAEAVEKPAFWVLRSRTPTASFFLVFFFGGRGFHYRPGSAARPPVPPPRLRQCNRQDAGAWGRHPRTTRPSATPSTFWRLQAAHSAQPQQQTRQSTRGWVGGVGGEGGRRHWARAAPPARGVWPVLPPSPPRHPQHRSRSHQGPSRSTASCPSSARPASHQRAAVG
jgi:hypothetical protein